MLEVEPVLILRKVYGSPTNLDDSDGHTLWLPGSKTLNYAKDKRCEGVLFVCCRSHNVAFLEFRYSLTDKFKKQRHQCGTEIIFVVKSSRLDLVD